MKNNITVEQLSCIFNRALATIHNDKKIYNIDCSEKIEFGGLSDKMDAVTLVFNPQQQLFLLFYSKHYLNNKQKNIFKTFMRYIICTNTDGTFKNYLQTKQELNKYNGNEHYEATYINGYLHCDIDLPDTVYCKRCQRTYKYPKDSPIFQNLSQYSCECGGKLLPLIKTNNFDRNKSDIYFYNNYGDKKPHINVIKFSKEYFQGIIFTEQEYNEFINFIQDKEKITKLILLPEIEKVIDENKNNVLKMFNKAFPKQYAMVYRYLKIKYRKTMDNVSQPNKNCLNKPKQVIKA